jgi:two-component system, OmpR family, phosphate regulon sensor histidine kinase PhoR
MGGLGFYMVNSSRNTQIHYLESELINEAKLTAGISLSAFFLPAPGGTLDSIAKSIGNEISTRVTYISTNGTVLGDTDENPAAMENHSSRPEFIQALAVGLGESTRYSATLHEGMMYVAVPVEDGEKVLGVARVSLPLSDVQNSINTSIAAIIASLIITGLLVIFAAAGLARMITRPVREITGAAEGIAAGKLDTQIPVRSSDEIGRLGRSFNEMSSNVKNMMAAISDERSRLVSVLSGLSDGVLMTDSRERIVLANPAAERLFGFKEAAVKGRSFIEAVHDHEMDEIVKRCLQTIHEHSTQVDSAGGRFIRAITVPIKAGNDTGVLVLFQDLTELRNLQTMRREFIGNISHELRTPLAAIKAIGDTLRDGAINDKEAAGDFLNRLDVEIEGMTQMVNELIDLSRIETGQIKLRLEQIDINKVIAEVISRMTPQADRRQISISRDLAPDILFIQADRERIQHVITNILHNAIKFTPPGGRVSISTRFDSGSVVTRVTDTGIGISKEDLPHIFERFFKADRSRSTSGTGLGLAIAKHIIQSHSGNIWVESEEGKGSTFGFSLPLKIDLTTGRQTN